MVLLRTAGRRAANFDIKDGPKAAHGKWNPASRHADSTTTYIFPRASGQPCQEPDVRCVAPHLHKTTQTNDEHAVKGVTAAPI